MLKAFKIWRLKCRARAIWKAIHRLEAAYDCGPQMIDELTGGRLSRLEADFNAVMAELRAIDINAPGRTQ